jgi:putative nucleotidyltransferase with HDIG domain
MTLENNTKVLFVDDEESILEIATEYFSEKGYSVITANNGRQAVEILNSEKIDCCFTDINMPEMNGLEFAEEMRKIDNTIPIIVMTGYPSLENTIKTLQNGVVDFLIKPINLNQMEVCLRRVLKERGLFVENVILKKEVEGKDKLEKLNKELFYKLDEINILNKIMSDVSEVGTSSDIYKLIVDMTTQLTKADEAVFYVINEVENRPFEVERYPSAINGTNDKNQLSKDSSKDISPLIMETASDKIPLLISENKGTKYLSPDISSFMSVPLKIQGKVFGIISASIKQNGKRFTDKELYYMSFMTQKAAAAIENLALYEHINRGLMTTLNAFVKAIEARDPYTEQHSNRVTELSVLIGMEVGLGDEEIDILKIAGPLHDIGKIGIRDDILLKPGKLTDEEFDKIMEHPNIGANIVGQLGMWEEHQKIIRHHHERYDGGGYPGGLKKNEIPMLARIVTVADAYDAMASDRAYRKKMETEKIIRIIKECSGTQFDPEFVEIFLKLHSQNKIEDLYTFVTN